MPFSGAVPTRAPSAHRAISVVSPDELLPHNYAGSAPEHEVARWLRRLRWASSRRSTNLAVLIAEHELATAAPQRRRPHEERVVAANAPAEPRSSGPPWARSRLEFGLANFRDYDYHFVTPLEFTADQDVVISVQCDSGGTPGTACTPAASFTDFTEPAG